MDAENQTVAYQPRRLVDTVREFCRALSNQYTYSLRNADAIFGFLWGLPIPVVSLLIHQYAAGESLSATACIATLAHSPVFIVLALHPFLFAAIFGALGTMRRDRDRRIMKLLVGEHHRCQELAEANRKLAELDRLKTEFLANVTHELKSPLVTSLGYTDRMLGGHLGEVSVRQQKGLEVSKRNLVRLRTLIDAILDFSRLESGVAKFELVETDLRNGLHTAAENFSVRAQDRHISLEVHAPNEPALVLGDAPKLVQIIGNLVDNALKYSPEHGTIRLELAPVNGNYRVSVADQGPGIPADKIAKLFNRFYQADGSVSRTYGGVGLGLVIVKKLVDCHGGRIWIESQPGAGTTVYVDFPRRITATSGAATSPAHSREQEVAHATHSTH